MTGILLILAALAITVVLAVVLVSAVTAALRSRQPAASPQQPGKTPAPAPGKSTKPALVPWLVISGLLLVVLTAIGAASLEGCRALGRSQKREQSERECRDALHQVPLRLAAYWDQHKELPPPGAVAMMAACPLGNQFRYVGHRNARLGNLRVLAIECEPHESGDRQAVVADQRFLDARKEEKDFQQGGRGGNQTYVQTGYPGSPHNYFYVLQVSASQYEGIRGAVEGE